MKPTQTFHYLDTTNLTQIQIVLWCHNIYSCCHLFRFQPTLAHLLYTHHTTNLPHLIIRQQHHKTLHIPLHNTKFTKLLRIVILLLSMILGPTNWLHQPGRHYLQEIVIPKDTLVACNIFLLIIHTRPYLMLKTLEDKWDYIGQDQRILRLHYAVQTRLMRQKHMQIIVFVAIFQITVQIVAAIVIILVVHCVPWMIGRIPVIFSI